MALSFQEAWHLPPLDVPSVEQATGPPPPEPCIVCGCPALWLSIYDAEQRCVACEPIPADSIARAAWYGSPPAWRHVATGDVVAIEK